jgi:hypothetical protein
MACAANCRKAAPELNKVIMKKESIKTGDAIRIFGVSLAAGWSLILLPGLIFPPCA